MSLDESVERAVDECIQEGILKDFLRTNRNEVIAMSIFEYNKDEEEKKLRKAEYEAGREDGKLFGRQEGRQEAIKEMMINMLKAGEPDEKIAQYTGYTVEKVKKIKITVK